MYDMLGLCLKNCFIIPSVFTSLAAGTLGFSHGWLVGWKMVIESLPYGPTSGRNSNNVYSLRHSALHCRPSPACLNHSKPI